MIYRRLDKYGLDVPIDRMQTFLDSHLNWSDKHVYGRIDSNDGKSDSTQNGASFKVPEWWIKGDEYEDIFLDDKKGAVIGFNVTDRRLNSASIDIIFSIRLDKIYGTNVRNDEKCLVEVIQSIGSGVCGFVLDDLVTGVKDTFEGFDITRYPFRDMQPYFNFALKCTLNFKENYC